MSDAAITTLEGLEAVIGKTPGSVNLKVIDHLDDHARRWIANSPLLFAGFDNGSGPRLTMVGGVAGFASGDRDRLVVPLSGLDDPELAEPGSTFGGLFLIPTIGETLRVNGRVAAVGRDTAIVIVDECYGHCASRLEPECPDLAARVAAVRFAALATFVQSGHLLVRLPDCPIARLPDCPIARLPDCTMISDVRRAPAASWPATPGGSSLRAYAR